MNCYQFRDLRSTTKIRYAYVNRTPNRSKRNFSRINELIIIGKDRRRNSVKANKPSTSKKR